LFLWGEAYYARPVAAQTNASLPGTDGVLVLQDGGVLTGTFTRMGDRYVLTREGSELQIAASRVLVACRSLEEAYDERRKRIQLPSAESHLALAEWCLRYGLLPQAAREIVDARGLEPQHRRLAWLERRLAAASSPRPQHTPRVDQSVQPVAHVQMSPVEPDSQPQGVAIDELPPGALELFTRRVQPILVNNCTISGCHQPSGKQEFQLDRALLHGLANRRSTMRNLAETLALVDREQPHLSPLLSMPRQAHGGMRSPALGPRQAAAYSHIVDWVALVAETDAQEEGPTPSAEQEEVTPGAESGHPLLDEVQGGHAFGREIRFGARLRAWQPKDPFDPEIFNRSTELFQD
jgi:hypothetical protein